MKGDKILQLLDFSKEMVNKTKIHFAIGLPDRYDALYRFYDNTFKDWQEFQNKKNFERDYIFSLIYYKKDEWLFAGIYKRLGLKRLSKKYKYETELLDIGKDFIGRLIIKFEKKFRYCYVNMETYVEEFTISEILKQEHTIYLFPGYEYVRVNYDFLKKIINSDDQIWKTALKSVKGVYLITVKTNGKFYVGSATGKENIWGRWKNYVENGHGGNIELKKIINKKGIEYASNFQFSILEIKNLNTDDDEVIKRENFWKEVLLLREFRYNKN